MCIIETKRAVLYIERCPESRSRFVHSSMWMGYAESSLESYSLLRVSFIETFHSVEFQQCISSSHELVTY